MIIRSNILSFSCVDISCYTTFVIVELESWEMDWLWSQCTEKLSWFHNLVNYKLGQIQLLFEEKTWHLNHSPQTGVRVYDWSLGTRLEIIGLFPPGGAGPRLGIHRLLIPGPHVIRHQTDGRDLEKIGWIMNEWNELKLGMLTVQCDSAVLLYLANTASFK